MMVTARILVMFYDIKTITRTSYSNTKWETSYVFKYNTTKQKCHPVLPRNRK